MAEHPLLVFPRPALANRTQRGGRGQRIKVPDIHWQAERLTPQFQRLQQAMERQRLSLQDNPLGLQPEKALVLETIGSVENFISVIRNIHGLEWLGEVQLDNILPDYGFKDEHDPQKPLRGQLFLVMADERALHEIHRLFVKWRQNPEMKFPRGLAPLKHAFRHLYRIRPWDVEDRIRETGILEDWEYRVKQGQELIPFEAELWFRQQPDRRQQAARYIRNVIEALGGEVVQQCIIPEIAHHGLLGRIPVNQVSKILKHKEVRLLQCEDIMHLRPIGQCAVRVHEDAPETSGVEQPRGSERPQGYPIVALLDGLPLTRHVLLSGRLTIDDPDGVESAYQARERRHGTAMASLICHGDLNEGGEPSKRPVYVRPIVQPRRGFGGEYIDEAIPEGILPIDLVHRAVRRLFEGEGNDAPVAPTIRVVNLSVCDRSRPFVREMSSLARLLDWLSWKYNVLFVVSAGNHPHDIELNVPRTTLSKLNPEEREKAIIQAIAADTRHRRLLSPAETMNGLTVAAAHSDASTPMPILNIIDPFTRNDLPSTISAHGPGYRRSIKPDVLLPGGRQFLSEKPGTTHPNAILQASNFVSPPGQRVAAPGTSGELDRTWYTRGTSNAAALASRWANLLYDIIEELRGSGADLPSEYDAVLLKALLVHGADWGDAYRLYESVLKGTQNSRIFRDYVTRYVGYGIVNVAKVTACTDQRVTVLGVGKLMDGQAHEFFLPLPPSLSAVTHKRRLTITLAWITPVNSLSQKYRIAHLWFDPKNRLTPDRIYADARAVQRGTVQHEVLEGDQAVDFQDGDTIAIKVNCRAEAGRIDEPIRYGLVVTLEVAEDVSIPIYQEVRDRLRVRVPIRS